MTEGTTYNQIGLVKCTNNIIGMYLLQNPQKTKDEINTLPNPQEMGQTKATF